MCGVPSLPLVCCVCLPAYVLVTDAGGQGIVFGGMIFGSEEVEKLDLPIKKRLVDWKPLQAKYLIVSINFVRG